MHIKLYVLDNILKLKSKATFPMYKCSNFSKLFIQNFYWQKAHSLAYLRSTCYQFYTYSTLRGGNVGNVPDEDKN